MTVRFTSWQHVGQWARQASWPEGLHGALDFERNRERKLRNAAQQLRGGGGRRALWRAEAFSERETES